MSLDEKTNVQSGDSLVENFQPPSDWDHKKESDTLILMLPGFRREQLKVQVSSDRVLRLSGQRKISENKWRKFQKDEPLSESHDTSGISAKFEAGMLYVRLPKIIRPTQQEEPSKPDQQQITTQQQPSDPKETKDHEQPVEQSKTSEAQTPLVQEPKGDHKDSQMETEKEKSKAVPEEKSKTSEAKEMHETTLTALNEQNKDLQKKLTQKEDHDEDVQKKLPQKELDHEDVAKKLPEKEKDHEDMHQKKLTQKEKGKAVTGSNIIGRGLDDEGLSKRSVVKMKEWLDMICGLVEEVKKQNKMPHFVVLIFLVLLIGLYIRSLVKSSFGGVKDQEF